MAEVIAIAGIVVPAVVAFVAPAFVEFVKKKMNERKESVSDIHEVLEKGLKELLAFQKDRSKLYKLSKTQVSDIEKRVTSLDEEYKQVKEKKWSYGKRRDHVKEEIKGALEEVIGLLEKCKDMNVERVIKENGVPSIENYQTLQKAFQDIQDLLQNGVKCVSLRGQKGVGKTTIMQHLNNHFLDRADFDMVIFIKVAADEQTNNIHILQKIADRIKVDREGNETEVEVSGRILKVLEDKRYLLILDGVRQTIDGIWNNLDISKDEKDSKVVIATHYHLAWKSACVQRDVKLKKLTPTEAWKMFRDIVGANLLPAIQSEARLVCQKFCCCLPLLIYPIAWSFKNGAPIDWGTPFPQDEVDGVKEIYSILEICYERLGDESKQKCFLYASLYPANSDICTHQLVECCIVQGFLGRVDADTKYSEMRSRAKDKILRQLVNVAFLEEGQQMRYVKMSDLYRQLALYISSKDPNSECRIYVDNEEHKEPFRSTSWEDAKWVSMVDSGRDSLPASQNYGSLQTLLLRKNLKLVEIPSDFFYSMSNLLVLNLYGNKISKLPSLEGLTGLKVFYLNGCSELKICSQEIQSLQHLEVLDIRGTRVNLVPCLESLRCLRISYIAGSNCHGISKLHKLEELTIEVKSLPQWCNGAEDIIQEVASLENLTTFRCSFPSSETLGKFLETSKSWRGKKQFTSFQFFVGCDNSKHPKIIEFFGDRICKYVKYCNGDKKDDIAITEMLPHVEAFELMCHKSVSTLLELVNTSNLERLRGLLIEGCSQMSVVVAGDVFHNAINDNTPENVGLLPNLEQLYLDNLQHLGIVFRGPLHRGSFSMLHNLTLKNCSGLTSIFSEVAVDDFPELQKLVVQNCSKIEVLIKVTEREQNILPKLKVLILNDLLNFKSICPNENLAWCSLKQLSVQQCPELKALPFNTTNAANLRTIEGEKEWWSNLEWTHREVHERFKSSFSAST